MSDDEDDDLFASDSDDTGELIAASSSAPTSRLKKKAPPAPAAKKPPPKQVAATKNDSSSDSDGGLFDSDSEDEDDKKPAAAVVKEKPLSKKERMEALAKRRKKETAPASKPSEKPDSDRKAGYESGDSYDSADFQRTADDDAFLDTTGEDEEAVRELYADQHFDDDRPDRDEHKKKKRKMRYDDEAIEDNGKGEDVEPDNPIMAAVHRMKKKKREKKSLTEMEDEVKLFLGRMETAAEDDEMAVAERRPATKKLAMLNEVTEMMARRDMQRSLLEMGLLTVCRRWIQPLPSGKLGNVTVRDRLIDAIGAMNGENGISSHDLKVSEFGKTVMVLYKHRDETPTMKRKLKTLIEQWSRPIFQKSGNMRDLERVNRGEKGLAALSRQQQIMARQVEAAAEAKAAAKQDIQSMIADGKKGSGESGINRVRVPFSKGFAFTVRPEGRVAGDSPSEKRRGGAGSADTRGKLSKRMVEKGRAVSKNQRSANISIEGRRTKG